MIGGQVELGIGPAWYEWEQRYFGIPFRPLAERFDRLAEQLEVITGLWRTAPGERFSYHGRYYRLEECASIPRPGPPPPSPPPSHPHLLGRPPPRPPPPRAARG